MKKLLAIIFTTFLLVSCGDFLNPYADLVNKGNSGSSSGNDNQTEEDDGNTGGDSGNTGGDSGNTGGDSGNTGGDSGNTGGDSGNTGGDSGNTGGDSGNTGGDSGNTGGDSGNTGGDSGNTGGGTVTEYNKPIPLKSGENIITNSGDYNTITVLLIATDKANPKVSIKTGSSSFITPLKAQSGSSITNQLQNSVDDHRHGDIDFLNKNVSPQPIAETPTCGLGGDAYKKEFNINSRPAYLGTNVMTQCVRTTNNIYFFLEESYVHSDAQTIIKLADKYETIYAKVTNMFNTTSPGKVSAVFANLGSNSGYFDPNDALNKNTKNLYINLMANSFTTDNEYTFAHELQHLLIFWARYVTDWPNILRDYYIDEKWINEGLGMYSEDATFNNTIQNLLSRQMYGSFMRNYKLLSLTSTFYPNGENQPTPYIFERYAFSSFFIHYLVDKYGEGVLKKFYNAKLSNTDGIVEAVKAQTPSFTGNFNSLFVDFVKDMYVASIGGTPDAFKSIKMKDLGLSFSTDKPGNDYNADILKHSFSIAEYPVSDLKSITVSNDSNVKAFMFFRKK